MSDCIFCKIVGGEIPARKVYEDVNIIAILDINPSCYGHTFIIPKKHYRLLSEMPRSEIGVLFEKIAELAEKIRNTVGADGFNMGINSDKAAGQHVDHVHIHIMPRWKGDGGGAMQSIVMTNVPKEKLDEIAEKIRNGLKEEKKPSYSAGFSNI